MTNAPVVNSDQNIVTVPGTNPQRFFRLGMVWTPTTLDGKLLMGYQGWFGCPQDGSAANR